MTVVAAGASIHHSKEPALSSKINLVAIEKDGCVRLATAGDITVVDIHPLGRNPFEIAIGPEWAASRVLLDMKLTKFIDSATVGWLLSSQREFRNGGGKLVLHSVEPRVRRLFEILRVEQVVTVATDETGARDAVLKTAA